LYDPAAVEIAAVTGDFGSNDHPVAGGGQLFIDQENLIGGGAGIIEAIGHDQPLISHDLDARVVIHIIRCSSGNGWLGGCCRLDAIPALARLVGPGEGGACGNACVSPQPKHEVGGSDATRVLSTEGRKGQYTSKKG
jgi:hypothetical protein